MDCNLLRVQQLIGKKWNIFILEGLLHQKALGFNQLRNRLGKITNRILSARLKTLEKYSLVQRKVIQEKPLLVSYSLTKKGKDFIKIILVIKRWGVEYRLVLQSCISNDCNTCQEYKQDSR